MTLRRVMGSGAVAPLVYMGLFVGGCDLTINSDKSPSNDDTGTGTVTTVEGGLVVQSFSGVSDNNGYFKQNAILGPRQRDFGSQYTGDRKSSFRISARVRK